MARHRNIFFISILASAGPGESPVSGGYCQLPTCFKDQLLCTIDNGTIDNGSPSCMHSMPVNRWEIGKYYCISNRFSAAWKKRWIDEMDQNSDSVAVPGINRRPRLNVGPPSSWNCTPDISKLLNPSVTVDDNHDWLRSLVLSIDQIDSLSRI